MKMLKRKSQMLIFAIKNISFNKWKKFNAKLAKELDY